MQTRTSERYKLLVRFGLGGAPLGNEFAVITEKVAYATLEAAWSAGVRYYDTSPWYGLGLCASVGSAASCTPRTGGSM